MGLGIGRIDAKRFLEMTDRLFETTGKTQRLSEVIVGTCKFGSDPNRFSKLFDGLVVTTLGIQRDTEVVADVRALRFELQRRLEMHDSLIDPALEKFSTCEVVVGHPVVLGHGESVSVQRKAAAPVPHLCPCQYDECYNNDGGRDRSHPAHSGPPGHDIAHPPSNHDEKSDRGQVCVTVSHRLFAHLHETNHGEQGNDIPEPPGEQISTAVSSCVHDQRGDNN